MTSTPNDVVKRYSVVVSIAVMAFSSWGATPAREISTALLLDDMVNMAGMAEFPNPSYTCKQFSSYDRKSTSPGNEDWFANGDAGQYLRVEERDGQKEFVMMDAAGPGAVVRIWSANPAGTLRIYLDGAEKPVIESPMPDLLGGRFQGLPRPIAGEYSKGWNLYFPIPYARSCKITSDKGDFYYHVGYRTYPNGTKVKTFTAEEIKALAPAIENVAKTLSSPLQYRIGRVEKPQPVNFHLMPREGAKKKFSGSRAITGINLELSAADAEAALRSTILRITFDGDKTVEAPLGDFFGTGPGVNAFATLPVGMSKNGSMYSHWFMPFRKSAVVELVNLGAQKVSVSGVISLAEHHWTEASMHFHAKWRVQFDVPTRPMIDWNYLTAKGQGVFAGVALSIDNPVKDWWGEGDEKIYVDGESFPSHFGTGTEDYYGYAWCWPEPFTHAYHSQPRCDGPGNYGRTSVNRFDILDRIPFNHDIKFDMELWHWRPNTNVNMAVTAYWYAKPAATDAFKPIQRADTVIRPMPEYVVFKAPGAIEGESMKILRKTGEANAQDWDGLSNLKHLWWHAGMKPGDSLVVGFEAPEAGKYHVIGRFVSAKDYGIHQLAINGQNAGEPIDFYNPEVEPTDEKDLGVFELKRGENEFSATVVGANEKAIKSYMFGLDYLVLKPAK